MIILQMLAIAVIITTMAQRRLVVSMVRRGKAVKRLGRL